MTDFTDKFIQDQREKMLIIKQQLINGFKRYDEEVKAIGREKTSEEGDMAQAHLEQKMNISLRDKDMKKLREIDLALRKIEEGTYGYCEETEEPIEMKRLIHKPWAKLSLQAAEELEMERKHFRKAI